MNAQEFCLFIDKIIDELYKKEQQHNIFKGKDLAVFSEQIIYDISLDLFKQNKIQCEVNYFKGGHQFPDITYTFSSGRTFGIEVKSTKSSGNSWVTNGNSILGKTSIKVIDTYIIFIKYNQKGLEIKTKRYEDSISDIVVTHSPRYKIDLSISNDNTFFKKSGISYSQLNNCNDPIKLIVDYFSAQGETAWWLPNEITDKTSPAIISSLSEFKQKEPLLTDEIYGKAYVLFPEILFLTSNQYKYNNLAKWLMKNYSITDASLRDKFSAGGKTYIKIQNFVSKQPYPRVIYNLQQKISFVKDAFNNISLDELKIYWPQYIIKNDNITKRHYYWLTTILSSWENFNNDNQSQLDYTELEFILSALINYSPK
ncbi:hypothetical protein [Gilliamella sp. Bif1-4]|uniref:hypothetical protein n=1 Tax=Gilliamella sp. Bif1-4 TaxID=3120233 RepID=UPI00080E099D|nr:hypothetical protein [Gilliamella apicola]OCG42703.1 hypothetical protein A9G25_01485 [Gilliamella apicola]